MKHQFFFLCIVIHVLSYSMESKNEVHCKLIELLNFFVQNKLPAENKDYQDAFKVFNQELKTDEQKQKVIVSLEEIKVRVLKYSENDKKNANDVKKKQQLFN